MAGIIHVSLEFAGEWKDVSGIAGRWMQLYLMIKILKANPSKIEAEGGAAVYVAPSPHLFEVPARVSNRGRVRIARRRRAIAQGGLHGRLRRVHVFFRSEDFHGFGAMLRAVEPGRGLEKRADHPPVLFRMLRMPARAYREHLL